MRRGRRNSRRSKGKESVQVLCPRLAGISPPKKNFVGEPQKYFLVAGAAMTDAAGVYVEAIRTETRGPTSTNPQYFFISVCDPSRLHFFSLCVCLWLALALSLESADSKTSKTRQEKLMQCIHRA